MPEEKELHGEEGKAGHRSALPERAGGAGPLAPADPLQYYLATIRSIPRLTPDEEHQLAVRVRDHNDADAALKLVTANLWLAVSIAFEFRNQFQNMLDLIQEGNIGLMRAIQKFDPFKGVPLPAYATYWVRAYIMKYILDNWRLVRVGTTNTRRKLLFNLNKATRELRNAGIDPTPKRLAEHFATTEDEVTEVQKSLSARDVSLETPLDGEGGHTYADIIGDARRTPAKEVEEEEVFGMVKRHIADFAKGLKDSDRAILEERLMSEDPLTLSEIGEKFGVTREAVRQAEVRLMKRLKAYLREKIPGISDFSFIGRG
ncbi:MAG: sigma-70 family RNA polymerase sigma factor [Nitrospinae bacterium]|nr:sigma-70 family RNA polymerase sigma factor [Nitrospinota bacterium]